MYRCRFAAILTIIAISVGAVHAAAQMSPEEAQRLLEASSIESLKAQLAERDDRIKSLESTIETLRRELNRATQRVTDLRAQVEALQPVEVPSREQARDANKLGGPLAIVNAGRLEIRVESARIDFPKVIDITKDIQTGTTAQLIIDFTVTNTSDDMIVEFTPLGGDDFRPRTRAMLSDDKGNNYRQISYGFGTEIQGAARQTSIYPGKTITDRVVFQRPIDSAKWLVLDFPVIDGAADEATSIRPNQIDVVTPPSKTSAQ